MDSETCRLCGSRISSLASIESGYGPECLASIDRAKRKVIFSDKDNSLHYNWIIKVNVWKSHFIKTFENVKFRSAFRKSFFNSIKENDRISKKQFEIIQDWYGQKHDWDEICGIDKEIISKKQLWLDKKKKEAKISRALIETCRREIREQNKKK